MSRVKVLALFLVLVLAVGLFGACGETDETTASTTGSTQSSETTTGSDEPFVNTMPITDDTTTITAWRAWSSTLLDDPNEITSNKILEEKTNIHVEFICASTTNAMEQFNIMVVSQDYADVIFANISSSGATQAAYYGGIDKAIADEVYVDMKDYMQYAPTFTEYFNSDDNIRKQCTTDGGAIFFNNIQSGEQPSWCGPMVRTDWLSEIGMNKEDIKSYDDWYEMLTAFKDAGHENAFSLAADGYDLMGYFEGGYDMIPSFYNKDGVVTYGAIEDGFRDYLTMMNKWYTEGLVDIDFFTRANSDKQTLFSQDKLGAIDSNAYTTAELWPAVHGGEGVTFEAVALPSVDGTSKTHFRRVNQICGTTPIFMTTAAVDNGNDIIATRWMDYRYTDDGAFSINYGEEGLHWTLGDDGLPHFTDEFIKNSEYSQSDMVSLHTDNRSGGYYMWVSEKDMYTEETYSGQDMWMNSSTGDWVMPPVTLTTEEGNEYSAIYTDIETFMRESVVSFIVGQKPLSEWDAYVQQINDMNIDRCIELYQQALDRYNAR